jgi:hypothetical protein
VLPDFFGESYSGQVDTVTGFSLIASARTCFVWQHVQVCVRFPDIDNSWMTRVLRPLKRRLLVTSSLAQGNTIMALLRSTNLSRAAHPANQGSSSYPCLAKSDSGTTLASALQVVIISPQRILTSVHEKLSRPSFELM